MPPGALRSADARAARETFPNAVQAANITCAGILSHESAVNGGQKTYLPEWTLSDQRPFDVALDEGREPAWEGETEVVPS